MREVEERSRRVKDIVRNRNYRQAVDVIEREVKRLEADDKPRARVRIPRDDGDIDIDVGGMVDFARSMLPKASIEAEDLQDGRTRRGIKTEKIGSTARGFVDLDEDGNPKGFGGTIDSINDANVSVYFGECEQSMSVTIGGKTVTFARNVCEDDKEEGTEGDKLDPSDDVDNDKPPNVEIPRPPAGYTGALVNVFLMKKVMYTWGFWTDLRQSGKDFLLGDKGSAMMGDDPVSSIQFIVDVVGYEAIIPLGKAPFGPLDDYVRAVRRSKGWSIQNPRFPTVIKFNYGLTKAGSHSGWNAFLPSTQTRFVRFSRPFEIVSSTQRVRAAWLALSDPETGSPYSEYLYLRTVFWELTYVGGSFPSDNYQPEPPPSLPILRSDMLQPSCEDSTKMIREIHQALGVRKLLEKNFQVPSNMMIPEGKGNHVNKDYLEIMSDLFKTIDNYGFDAPVTVTVQDTNKAQKGDQSIELKFNSLGAILKAQTELLIELKGDSANRLNIQIRLAYIMTRMYRTLAKLYYRTSAILDGLGIPIISKVVTLPIEFNVFGKKHWGAGKGFGKDSKKGQEPKLDLNDEDTTEAMLPDLLEIHDYEIEVDEFRFKSTDLYEIILNMAAKMRT